MAHALVRSGALIEEVQNNKIVKDLGLKVEELEDLRQVPIEILDKISWTTMQGGKVLAGGKGALLGLLGIVGMTVDPPMLMTLNLRFIAQIAATYGYDVSSSPDERAFALNVLGASSRAPNGLNAVTRTNDGEADRRARPERRLRRAGARRREAARTYATSRPPALAAVGGQTVRRSSSQAAKTAFLRNLNEIAVAVGKGTRWKYLNDKIIVQLIQQIAKAIGVKLTKKKLGQIIPIVGSVVAGGSNYKFTHDNLVAARMMYRKRWLIERCLKEIPGEKG